MPERRHRVKALRWKFLNKEWILFGVAVLVLAAGFFFNAKWVVIGWAGILTVFMAIEMIGSFRRGSYGVDLLALVAIWATIIAGEYVAGALVMVMWTGGEGLESYANGRAKRELAKLLDRRPMVAHVVQDEKMDDVEVEKVKVGDTIQIKTGEMVPMDGTLIEGAASLDTSNITGEALPVEIKDGGRVISGSVNAGEAFLMTVTASAEESEYGQILKLVREIEGRPANFVRMADRYAVPFTVLALAIAGVAWAVSGEFARFAQVLVVASPCPLILAAPVAFMSGMSRASKSGIIVRSGVALEKLARVRGVAFDKTGTLSRGEVEVSRVEAFSDSGFTGKRVLRYVAEVESGSSHILARSVTTYAKTQGIKFGVAEKIEADEGLGMDAVVDEKKVIIGSLDHMKAHRVDMSLMPKGLDLQKSAIFLAVERRAVGVITFADVVRKDAAGVVKKLRKMGVRDVVMVTGDGNDAAKFVARQVGIDEGRVFAESMPGDKVKVIEREVAKPVMFVGDGVNDAPVLAAADVGVAMGAYGSTAASESADVVVMADNLGRVVTTIEVARRTMRVGRESTLVGIAVCTVLMVLAAFGFIPVLIGALLQEGLDVASILNALRARR